MTGNLWYNVNEKTNLCFFFLGQNFFWKIGISTVQREFCQGREAADAASCLRTADKNLPQQINCRILLYGY